MNEDVLKQGIELIQSGNIPAGLRILAEIVKQDPQNDMAWTWLAACYTEKERKIYCLNRAVRINPHNSLALEGLTQLGEPLPVVEPLKEESITPETYTEPAEVEPVTPETYTEPAEVEPVAPVTYTEPAEVEPVTPVTYTESVEPEPVAPETYTEPIEAEPVAPPPPFEPAAYESEVSPSVLSKFETAQTSSAELEPPEWTAKGKRARTPRKPRGKTNPLLIVLLVILVLILAVVSYLFVPRFIRQIFPEASHFNENTQAFIQEVDLLMAISDGSNNLGAFKTQQGLVYKAYDKLLMEWPPQMIYQKNEIDTALKGWSAVGAISDVAKAPDNCKVEGSLLDEVKSYTNSLSIDKTCPEWASAVMEIANKHFNQARPGLESFPAR